MTKRANSGQNLSLGSYGQRIIIGYFKENVKYQIPNKQGCQRRPPSTWPSLTPILHVMFV